MQAPHAQAAQDAVLVSEDLWREQLWQWLAALRFVSRGMCSKVDGAVQVVASPRTGASANDLASALLRWPSVRDLNLLNVSDASALSPLSTASLSKLTSFTVRQAPAAAADGAARPPWYMPAFSSSVSATLQVVDISGCALGSIDFVRSCVQLRCLWMPGCHSVSDLSPLGACSETLEELWLAHSGVAGALRNLACSDQNMYTIVDSGAIPLLVQLLGPASSSDVQEAAAGALQKLVYKHAQNQASISGSGGFPSE
ncbi:hypothetical protein FOA52_010546 [Chlamydomonas sp. UWO 241]|nr:hypothetical protein FOA52_010546 [Chlamydomonas sp. UWO 241]